MKERTSFDNLEEVLQRGRSRMTRGVVTERWSKKEEKSLFSTFPGEQKWKETSAVFNMLNDLLY